MKRAVVVSMTAIGLLLGTAAPAVADNYVSCPDGHIVENLGDCPPVVIHTPFSVVPGVPTGGGGGGGLLGTIGRVVGGFASVNGTPVRAPGPAASTPGHRHRHDKGLLP